MTEITSRNWGGYELVEPVSTLIREKTVEETIELVRGMLGKRKRRIALLFPTEAYSQSKLLALVVVCSRLVREAGGRLAVVRPDQDFLRMVRELGLDMGIRFVPSLEELEAS